MGKGAKYVVSIDCGTTVIKSALFDLSGRMKGLSKRSCSVIFYKDGRVESDAGSILKQVFSCVRETVRRSGVNSGHIAALSVSSQRATVVPADAFGAPLMNAISWQDLTGGREVLKLKKRIDDKKYYRITGLPNNPVFSISKIMKFRDTYPSLYKKTSKFLLVHDYVIKHLGSGDFFTDWSNASLTGMFDINKFEWSGLILRAAGIPIDKLPVPVPSGKIVGYISAEASIRSGIPEGTAIVSGGGDQQCAGLGAGSVRPGVLEITLGTAGVTLAYSGKVIRDPLMRITCSAHAMPGAWIVEGLQNSAGASLDWIKKILYEKATRKDISFSKLKGVAPGAGGLLFYPFLAGASAPHWDPDAKSVVIGLTHRHGRAEVLRAILEGISMETKEILDVFHSIGISVNEIRLTGGGSNIWIWNQIQADIFGRKVSTLVNKDASLLGGAMLAAYGIGAFPTLVKAADRMVRTKKTFVPVPGNSARYKKIYGKYRALYDIFDKQKIFNIPG